MVYTTDFSHNTSWSGKLQTRAGVKHVIIILSTAVSRCLVEDDNNIKYLVNGNENFQLFFPCGCIKFIIGLTME